MNVCLQGLPFAPLQEKRHLLTQAVNVGDLGVGVISHPLEDWLQDIAVGGSRFEILVFITHLSDEVVPFPHTRPDIWNGVPGRRNPFHVAPS